MPTTLPPAYTARMSGSLISWGSVRFTYLALPPVFMLLINFAVVICEHRSSQFPEKTNLKLNLAFCDEMATCGAEASSIRKLKRR
jgi:hypothetical protein